jgi:RNA-directed DNA polymerase
LKVNAAKSGTGRVWEGKFLGFRLDRDRRIGVAAESMERFKAKVREMWRGNQSRTSNQLRDDWSRYVRGWWGYFRLAAVRQPIFRLEGWIRRHIRKCFWLRWHSAAGRERALRRLGLRGRALHVAFRSRGSWHLAGNGSVQTALSNKAPRLPHAIRPCGDVTAAGFNRRIRKTVRPVAGEGDRDTIPVTPPDPRLQDSWS